MNKFIGLGNLTKDPVTRETKSGKTVCSFSLAINNQNNTVTYLDVESWEKVAQNCQRFLKKGRQTLIEGRLQLNTWKSQSGENRSKLYCIADRVTFLQKSDDKQNNQEDNFEKDNSEDIIDDEFADIPF
jgi:single-strand DNA-binding protein